MTRAVIDQLTKNPDFEATMPVPENVEGTETKGEKVADWFVREWPSIKIGLEMGKTLLAGRPILEGFLSIDEMILESLYENLLKKEEAEVPPAQ